jgi:hypothetical protein
MQLLADGLPATDCQRHDLPGGLGGEGGHTILCGATTFHIAQPNITLVYQQNCLLRCGNIL